MRDSKLPWPAIILELLTLLLLYLDGVGLLMVALTGAFWTFSLLAVWGWCSEQTEPDAPREIEGNARQQQLEQGHLVRRALASALEGTGAPMLLVDRVVEMDGDQRAVGVKNVTMNEHFFQGHYPGTPIMPGVLIIEAMAQLGGLLLSQRLEHTGKIAVLLNEMGVIEGKKDTPPFVEADRSALVGQYVGQTAPKV